LKEKIRALALELGADVCGFAGIERFADAPRGFSPSDVYAECRTAIVFGVAMPKGLLKVDPRLIYNYFNEAVIDGEIDRISFRLAREIERRFGCAAVPVPCDAPYEYWDAEQMEGRGLLSMKHAAVCAGLGALGKNTLLLNGTFGNMLNIGAVLTDAALPSDPPQESICIQSCTKCVDGCPAGAIRNGVVVQKLCREHTYGRKTARGYDTTECNLCRAVCPVAFGKSKKAL
jgi:epoxyqueuosine reductase